LAQLGTPEARARAVLRRLRTEPFRYTLQPPLLPGRDSIDDFLFDTRAGFCEHYAGAFVFLMRAAGVPARVVTGYQGGELNPVDGYYTVRQSDAHAWAEIWVADRGWLRIDPTAAVSPDRIERGLARALPAPAPFGIEGLLALRDPDGPLARLRFQLAALNNGWNQWVLSYTPERQRGVLAALNDAFGNLRSLAGALAVLALAWLARWVRQRTGADPVERLYLALCARLARHGVTRAPHEGPHSLAARVRASGLPGHASAVRFLDLYSDYKYAPPAPQRRALPGTLRRLLRDVR
jgi:transglutaminase-like putative cysteine protease